MIEALLHLSVLSVAVPVAYLGVDKVRHSEDSFNNRLIEISSSVKEAFLEADLIEDEKVKIPKNWFMKEVPLLASVAGLKLHPSIFKRVNCVVLIWWSIFGACRDYGFFGSGEIESLLHLCWSSHT